jgi:multiple sugar transport system permease protein
VRIWRLSASTYLAILAFLIVLPFYWMAISAIRPLSDLARTPVSWWPGGLSIRNFIDVWTTMPLLQYMLNSLVVAAITTVISVSVAALCAYSIVRYQPRGAVFVLAFVLFTMTIPHVVALVPFYELLTRIGALDTRWGLALSYTVWALPFNTLLMHGYFKGAYQREVEEAALLDGCSSISVLWRIVLPLSKPGLIAASTFTVLTCWNEVIWASVITNTDSSYTAPIGLMLFIGQNFNNTNLGAWMAGAIYLVLPVMAGFLAVQRHFVAVYAGVGK